MTWKTHKYGAFTSTILIYPTVLKDLWLMQYNALHYTILCVAMLILVYDGAKIGTAFCDFDHDNVESIPLKNTVTRKINWFLQHCCGEISHRSWQTHSMDLYCLLIGIPTWKLHSIYTYTLDIIVYMGYVILLGFLSGALIHCFMDLFTTRGGYISIILAYILHLILGYETKRFKVKLAPTWFWYPKIRFCNRNGKPTLLPRLYKYHPIRDVSTGTAWEDNFRAFVKRLNNIFIIISILVYLRGWFPDVELPHILDFQNYWNGIKAWVSNGIWSLKELLNMN